MAEENVLASLVYDWGPILNDIIGKMDKGVLGGAAYDLTFIDGGLKIVWNTDHIEIDPELIAYADLLYRAITMKLELLAEASSKTKHR